MATLIDRVLGRTGSSTVAELLPPSVASVDGAIELVNEGDGRYDIVDKAGRPAVTPEAWSQYLYFRLSDALKKKLGGRAVIEVDYFGREFGQF